MIRSEQMVPLFLEACPGLQPSWTRYVIQTMNSKSPAGQQSPVFEVVFPYLLGHVKRNYFKEMPAACAVMETLLSEGDEEARILVETDILIPLQAAVSSFSQCAVVEQELGPRAQMVWQVIERSCTTEEEQREDEQPEQHLWSIPGYSFEEARPLYVAFALVGGGPFTLGWGGGGMDLLSLGTLLAIWIGLSIAERFQRKQLLTQAQEQESSRDNSPETGGPDRVMIQQVWTLLDRAMGLLFVLGIPIGLSVVMRHRVFLDSFFLDVLIVMVGAAAVGAILFRDRLWNRSKIQDTKLTPGGDEHQNAVRETNPRPDARKSLFRQKRRVAAA